MKTLKYLSLIILIVGLVSCSSDDDNHYEFTKNNLSGIYHLKSLKTKEVKSVKVDGFKVVTTTTKKSDTEDFTFEFTSDNKVTKNGTYRIVKVKKQNGQQNDSTYIVNIDHEKVPYTINKTDRKMTIDGSSYKVLNFNPEGLHLKLEKEEALPDGGKRTYTKELKLGR